MLFPDPLGNHAHMSPCTLHVELPTTEITPGGDDPARHAVTTLRG